MKTTYRPFARKFRQLNNQAKKIKRLYNDGSFALLSEGRQRMLTDRLKKLYCDLRGKLQPWRIKKTLAGLSFLFLSLSYSPQLKAQTFGAAQENPFNIDSQDGYNFVALADLDNDGDLDIFLTGVDQVNYESVIYYLENVGTPESPDYDTPQPNPFGMQPVEYLTTTSLVDIDDDGDLDLITGSYNYGGDFIFQLNSGTAGAPMFDAPIENPFGLTPTYQFSTPNWADIDNDGDLDLFAGEYGGDLLYYENIGTASAPEFATPINAPFGIPSVDENIALVDFADMDNDGDLDLMFGGTYDYVTYVSHFHYSENTGTASEPNFEEAIIDPFGLTGQDSYLLDPKLADIDNDGDLDLFSTGYYNVLFFENLGAAPTSQDAVVETTISTPYTFIDTDFIFMDSDGDDFAAVKITNTTAVGTLELDGTAVINDQVIPFDEISMLVFTPINDEQGMPYDAFTFRVQDSGNGISIEHTMTINVGGVGTKDNELAATLQILPNPSSDYIELNLQSEGQLSSVQIKLIDESGRLVAQQTSSAAGNNWQEVIDLKTIAAGTYFVQLAVGGKTITRQFVKN